MNLSLAITECVVAPIPRQIPPCRVDFREAVRIILGDFYAKYNSVLAVVHVLVHINAKFDSVHLVSRVARPTHGDRGHARAVLLPFLHLYSPSTGFLCSLKVIP